MLFDKEIVLEVIKYFPKKKELTILDVGCGDASIPILLATYLGAKVYGIDISKFAIHYGTEQVHKSGLKDLIFCYSQDAENLDFDNDLFDVVTAIRVFHEFNNPQKAIKEIYRVIKKDGYFVIVDWDKYAETGVPERYYSVEEITNLLREKFIVLNTFQDNDLNFIFCKPRK